MTYNGHYMCNQTAPEFLREIVWFGWLRFMFSPRWTPLHDFYLNTQILYGIIEFNHCMEELLRVANQDEGGV